MMFHVLVVIILMLFRMEDVNHAKMDIIFHRHH